MPVDAGGDHYMKGVPGRSSRNRAERRAQPVRLVRSRCRQASEPPGFLSGMLQAGGL